MPRKPMKPCSHPNCPKLTHRRFCETHEKEQNKIYEKYSRDPATRKRYGSNWRKIRKAYISANPLCEECERRGRLVPAEEIHHITELSKGGTHDFSNLMSLCKSCHSTITAKEHLMKIF